MMRFVMEGPRRIEKADIIIIVIVIYLTFPRRTYLFALLLKFYVHHEIVRSRERGRVRNIGKYAYKWWLNACVLSASTT